MPEIPDIPELPVTQVREEIQVLQAVPVQLETRDGTDFPVETVLRDNQDFEETLATLAPLDKTFTELDLRDPLDLKVDQVTLDTVVTLATPDHLETQETLDICQVRQVTPDLLVMKVLVEMPDDQGD